MFNRDNIFEGEIKVGQRVRCTLHWAGLGTVVKIYGEQSPQTCASNDTFGLVTGGRADFDIIFDNGCKTTRSPEALLRSGLQWDVYDEVVDSEVVEQAHYKAAQYKAELEANAAARAERRSVERDLHRANHPELTAADPDNGVHNDAALAAKNIRKALKLAFPGVKFSVRKRGYDTINISWVDGPTGEAVTAYTSRHSSGTFDCYTDCAGWNDDNTFGQVFGEARHVFTYREFENEQEVCERIARDYCSDRDIKFEGLTQIVDTFNNKNLWEVARGILGGYTVPNGHEVLGCEPTENRSGCATDWSWFYKLRTRKLTADEVQKAKDDKNAAKFTEGGFLGCKDYPEFRRTFRKQDTAQKLADKLNKEGHDVVVVATNVRFSGKCDYGILLKEVADKLAAESAA